MKTNKITILAGCLMVSALSFGQKTNVTSAAVEYKQIAPDLEWDMKNSKGIPIASGVYLIHVNAEGIGETTIKWFNVNRKFDPTGL